MSWISAKKPPEHYEECLVTWSGELDGAKVQYFIDKVEYKPDGMGGGKWITKDIESRGYKNVEVTGWQSLPSPYGMCTESEMFEDHFGMSPEKARQILESLRRIVNSEVHNVIENADFYIDPLGYADQDSLEERYGKLEKDDDADGYACLYDYGKQNSAISAFMDIISSHTYYGGYTSATEACNLMGLEWK